MVILKGLALLAGLQIVTAVAVESAQLSSKPLKPVCSKKGTFMTQWVDHSDHGAGTFQQQIQVITEHFKPGGPILFFQGEESTVMTCVETTNMYDYARQLGGIAASIEHRYFGLSTPFGPNKSYTPEGFKYLTLDNVMDDAATFIKGIQANVTGAANSRAIVASGSYGGYLATAFRLNRPDSIYGAIAAAPPVNVFLTADGEVEGRFNWWNWISNVIEDRSAAAGLAIKKAFAALETALASGKTADLKKTLGLCRAPNGAVDEALLIGLMMMPYNMVTEFNYPFANAGRTPIANSLDKLIQTSLAHKNDPFGLLKANTLLWFKSLNSSLTCLDFETTSQQAVPLIEPIPFNYIVCTYVPIITTSVSNDTIFIAQDSAPSNLATYCKSAYGVTPMTSDQLAERYHLSQENYEKSERIIFSVGQYDPTTALAPPSLPITGNRNASKILYVSNMAHREELFAPDPSDKPEVIQARAIEVETIKEWLGRN